MSIFVNKEDLPYRRIFAAIDLEAFRTNLESIRGILPKGTKLCAVVKADAYGHGVKGLLGSLSGYADAYAVATEEEGALLRREEVTAPILVLGALQREEYRRAICCGLTVAISSLREAEGLSQEAETLYGTAHVHIAVETGMNRIGMRMEGEGGGHSYGSPPLLQFRRDPGGRGNGLRYGAGRDRHVRHLSLGRGAHGDASGAGDAA